MILLTPLVKLLTLFGYSVKAPVKNKLYTYAFGIEYRTGIRQVLETQTVPRYMTVAEYAMLIDVTPLADAVRLIMEDNNAYFTCHHKHKIVWDKHLTKFGFNTIVRLNKHVFIETASWRTGIDGDLGNTSYDYHYYRVSVRDKRSLFSIVTATAKYVNSVSDDALIALVSGRKGYSEANTVVTVTHYHDGLLSASVLKVF
jgi:hypothetical protein